MDTWDDGVDYENYMGRWSRPMARQFVSWLDVPNGARWLDVGCGTGAPAGRIADDAHPAHLAGIDPSPSSVRAARKRLGAQGPTPTHVGSLTEVDRYRLAAQLEHDLQTAPDGSITLIARAWAIRGVA